jgi:PQQ-dependent catabolism-associated CXXCW motif protein
LDDYRAPTPETVAGGVVIDTEAAYKLWQAGSAIWVDVLPAPRRPENLPPQALWMPVPRRNIPGSLWLPDIGRGALSPELEAYFRVHLEDAVNGVRDRPIVFYCLADCWMVECHRRPPAEVRASIGIATSTRGRPTSACR